VVAPKTQTAKVFRSGNSQAVRLPKEFQLDVSEVEISRRGEEIVLRKKPANLLDAFTALASVEGEMKRQQPEMQERDFTQLKKRKR
jgi:antitoxin VapB